MYGAPGTLSAGMGAGQGGIGYNGQVGNLKDFVSAVLGGAGIVAGGFPGALALGVNAIGGFKNGLGTTPALKDLRSLLFGARDPGAGGALSAGNIDLSGTNTGNFGAGNLAGTMETGLGGGPQLGDITGGGNSMSGSFGDHEHSFAGGGALNMAIRKRPRR